MSIEFKTDRIREEWSQLISHNHDLFTCIDDLSVHAMSTLSKDITITSIYRTPEENLALYASTPADQIPKNQPHCNWKAVDLRSYDFDQPELDALVAWINASYKNPSGRVVAFVHQVAGNAKHFHIQYKLDY